MPRQPHHSPSYSISVSGILYQQLQEWSEASGKSMASLVERLINRHLATGMTEAARAELSDLEKIAQAAEKAGESRNQYMMKAALMRAEKE